MGRAGGRLRGRIITRESLDDATRESMWGLFSRIYDGVEEATFCSDLDGKTHVILMHDKDSRELQGFSTLVRGEERLGRRRVVYVFSGDTVVAPAYWGQSALQNAFGRFITRTRLRYPSALVYWFLISKGYKTYLLLARNFPDHWPRHGRSMPPHVAALLDRIAGMRFGAAWQPAEGIVRFQGHQARLRTDVAPVPIGLQDDPDVRFFLARNPGHADGDELACLGRIGFATWAGYVGKRIKKRWSRAVGRWARPTGAEAARSGMR